MHSRKAEMYSQNRTYLLRSVSPNSFRGKIRFPSVHISDSPRFQIFFSIPFCFQIGTVYVDGVRGKVIVDSFPSLKISLKSLNECTRFFFFNYICLLHIGKQFLKDFSKLSCIFKKRHRRKKIHIYKLRAGRAGWFARFIFRF